MARSTKPLLVGLHNPLSRHAEDALYPAPPNCSGDRLVKMVQLTDATFTDEDYLRAFDRTNLWRLKRLPEGRLARAAFQEEGERVRQVVLERDDAVLFGVRVWDSVMRSATPEPFTCEYIRVNGKSRATRCWFMPHPSGRTRFYNREQHRRSAGEVLLNLARRGK